MNKKKIIDEVTEYLDPILSDNHFELVDVEFVKEGPNFYLRIYIDKEGGITIEDCQLTSRAIEKVLDEKDPIKDPYILEVSSPGLDRVLKKDKDFEKFKGSMIDVKLYEAVNKKKHFTAKLTDKNADYLTIEEDGSIIQLEMKNVAIVRLAIMF